MTQPQNLDARVTALETKVTALQGAVTSLQGALSTFTTRFTAMEQTLGTAQPRLLTLEEAARGFETRVQALERIAHEPSNADAARLSAVEVALGTLTETVSRLSQVSRPGRSLMREQLTDLQAQMAKILERLPEAK